MDARFVDISDRREGRSVDGQMTVTTFGLDRLFDGRLAPLVSHLSQRQALSDEDIAELKRLVEDLDHGR